MKALLIEGPGILEVKDIDMPTVGPSDVLIKVKIVGIHPQDYYMAKNLTTQGHKINPMPHIPGKRSQGSLRRLETRLRASRRRQGDCIP